MPAKLVNVNLLEKDELNESPIGRIINWATTYGRYIMITTEIIVLAAFVSRFSLDRKLTDLNETISQKQAIIEANLPFEDEIRAAQNQLFLVSSLINTQNIPLDTLILIKRLLPQDVYFESLTLNSSGLSIKAVAGTIEGFTVFMNNLGAVNQLTDVNLGEVAKEPLKGITFSFTAKMKTPKTPVSNQPVPAKTDENI